MHKNARFFKKYVFFLLSDGDIWAEPAKLTKIAIYSAFKPAEIRPKKTQKNRKNLRIWQISY